MTPSLHPRWAIVILLVLCASPAAFAIQDVHITSEQFARGVSITKGWKCMGGDDPSWSSPELDDSGWQPVLDTSLYATHIPSFGWAGIGWYRLRFSVDAQLAAEPVGLEITQGGASEIYLDGRLVHTLGTVSSERSEVEPFDPRSTPLALSFGGQTEHVIAVRYSTPKAIPASASAKGPDYGFSMSLAPINPSVFSREAALIRRTSFTYAIAGGLAAISFLHFVIFLFEKRSRWNAALAGFALGISAYTVLLAMSQTTKAGAGSRATYVGAMWVVYLGGWICCLTFLRSFFARTHRRQYWFALAGFALVATGWAYQPYMAVVAGMALLLYQLGFSITLLGVSAYAEGSMRKYVWLARLASLTWFLAALTAPIARVTGLPMLRATDLTLALTAGLIAICSAVAVRETLLLPPVEAPVEEIPISRTELPQPSRSTSDVGQETRRP